MRGGGTIPSPIEEVMGGATMVHQVGELERCDNPKNVGVLGGLRVWVGR